MSGRARNIAIAALALIALCLVAAPHRRAEFALQMHRMDDVAPQRVQAVVDLGVVAISVLVTWSRRLTA
jgi:hypothetical protein